MVNDDSGRRRARGNQCSTLLLVFGTEGPGRGLLEILRESSHSASAMGGLTRLVRVNVHGSLREESRWGRDWNWELGGMGSASECWR